MNTEHIKKEIAKLERELTKLNDDHNSEEEELLTLLETEDYQLCKSNLFSFLQSSWNTFDGATFKPSKHLMAISEHLEACYKGEIRNLVINIPPRASKTSLVSKAFPAWLWVQDPTIKVINCSYSHELSIRDSVATRNIINSEWYQKGLKSFWNQEFKLSRDTNQKHYYTNDKGGMRFATSTGGALTGSGANFILIDDPLKASAAQSKVQREACNDWFSNTLSTRLDDREKGVRIIIAQRLHQNDLPGYLLEQGDWEKLILPMLYEGSKYVTKIGWSDWRTYKDEVLIPERFSEDNIEKLRKELGPYGFAAQMQQRPVPLGGGLLKAVWFKTYWITPQKFESIVIAFDLSMTDSEKADNSAAVVIGRREEKYYVLDVIADKMDVVAQMEMITHLSEKYPYATKIVESKANGIAVITLLKKTIPNLIPIEPRDFGGNKEGRLSAIVPEVYAGNVYLPSKNLVTWLDTFLEEILTFPKGAHDDICDAFGYALGWLSLNNQKLKIPVNTYRDRISIRDIRSSFSSSAQKNLSLNPSHSTIRKIFNT